MANPILANNKNFQPNNSAATLNADFSNTSTDLMTVENTLHKVVGLFGVVLVMAAIGWFVPILALPSALVGLGIAITIAIKKQPSAPLTITYAIAEGLFVGGISSIFEKLYSGSVSQAVIATFVVIGVTLALFTSGKVRATPKLNKFFFIALSSYALFSLVNFFLVITGINHDPYGLRGSVHILGIPLGIILGVFAVLMGAYSLIMDFTFLQNGVNNRIDKKYGWFAAYGIIASVIWIYIEILRMIGLSRR